MAVEIMSSTDEKIFKSLLDAFPERFEFGCLPINASFSDKEKFVKKIAHHCLISRVNEEIDSFKKGLSTSGVLEILQRQERLIAAINLQWKSSHSRASKVSVYAIIF